jgi:hypothetical protein
MRYRRQMPPIGPAQVLVIWRTGKGAEMPSERIYNIVRSAQEQSP